MPSRIVLEFIFFLVTSLWCSHQSFVLPFLWGVVTHQKAGKRMISTTTWIKSSTTPIESKEDILTSLFGNIETRNKFFQQDFGKNVFYKGRSSTIGDLPSPLDQISIQDLYETSAYISLRSRGSFEYLNKTEMSYDNFTTYINEGGSAVIPIDEQNNGNYTLPTSFKNSIQSSLSREIGINIYHSGPNAVALNRHCDKYDVLVLQIYGHKEWEICMDNKVWTNVTLVPGDLLYVPKGIYHAATTVDGFGFSTHATIGLPDL